MSYPLQPYNPNNGAIVNQQFNRPIVNRNNGIGGDDDLIGSIFGLASRLMTELLRNGPDIGGIGAFMGSNSSNPHAQIFGISSMNVTQIECGPDGQPHIVQTHDERRIGPGGIRQTKKALRDPARGIDKMQIGYFVGDRGEIIERQLDRSTGQYRQEIQRHGATHNERHYPQQRQMQSQSALQQLSSLPQQQYQYYPQQQQLPSRYSQQTQYSPYSQKPQQALPAPSSYRYL
ncbi:unnamed protein product [Rotaria socialis]|uniref:Uncharacterized protein n=1 Tax=Rotaria socialis TaxID=392032 RepID=A0A821DBC1_9BILA|nr:unnamed protein product [Rotaria socialis]CAF4618922.1 unnamed protein product [Rotaria socialis]